MCFLYSLKKINICFWSCFLWGFDRKSRQSKCQWRFKDFQLHFSFPLPMFPNPRYIFPLPAGDEAPSPELKNLLGGVNFGIHLYEEKAFCNGSDCWIQICTEPLKLAHKLLWLQLLCVSSLQTWDWSQTCHEWHTCLESSYIAPCWTERGITEAISRGWHAPRTSSWIKQQKPKDRIFRPTKCKTKVIKNVVTCYYAPCIKRKNPDVVFPPWRQ